MANGGVKLDDEGCKLLCDMKKIMKSGEFGMKVEREVCERILALTVTHESKLRGMRVTERQYMNVFRDDRFREYSSVTRSDRIKNEIIHLE